MDSVLMLGSALETGTMPAGEQGVVGLGVRRSRRRARRGHADVGQERREQPFDATGLGQRWQQPQAM
jgi:hypothetical protein